MRLTLALIVGGSIVGLAFQWLRKALQIASRLKQLSHEFRRAGVMLVVVATLVALFHVVVSALVVLATLHISRRSLLAVAVFAVTVAMTGSILFLSPSGRRLRRHPRFLELLRQGRN
jgi:hypothetical protein